MREAKDFETSNRPTALHLSFVLSLVYMSVKGRQLLLKSFDYMNSNLKRRVRRVSQSEDTGKKDGTK